MDFIHHWRRMAVGESVMRFSDQPPDFIGPPAARTARRAGRAHAVSTWKTGCCSRTIAIVHGDARQVRVKMSQALKERGQARDMRSALALSLALFAGAALAGVQGS